MPTSRELAQRYAAASRKKRRRQAARPAASAAAAPAPAAPEGMMEAAAPESAPAPRAASLAPRVPRAKAVARRPFGEYREEYRYVGRDLRRVGMVAGSLLALL